MTRILVATPVVKELRALSALFEDEGHEVADFPCRLPAFSIEGLGLIAAAVGHGKAQCALATQHLLDTHGPFAAVIVAGAAGALAPTLRAGDVVVGTEAVEHDYKPRFHGIGPPPRHAASPELVEAILAAQPEHAGFSIHPGPIAGGDEDIVEAARARALAAATGALCVAWEGAGGARAAAFSGTAFAEVRAVTDHADGASAENYRVHLEGAVGNVGRVLLCWLQARAQQGTA